jgi:hypothetical protein
MASTVNLLLKASSNFVTDELTLKIENSVKQSGCWVVNKLTYDNMIQFQIKVFTDKLEKLYMHLNDAGLDLVKGSAEMISNASIQYSVFRDIEITLIVNEIPIQLTDNEVMQIVGKVL